MKSIYIYRKIVLLSVTVLATLMTSCTDFLTIIPPDRIVHEQFWQTKDDVNGMLATSYLKLATTDAVSKAIIWGELRADNITFESGKSKDDPIRYIVEANINEENTYTKWGIFYEAINYANLVIEYAPLVVERDPDFGPGDLDVAVGEMYAMRALCHFYLVRTFRDIPMALVPAINDSELPAYEQVHPLEALDYIMQDLDSAENKVMLTYSDPKSNRGRITRNAVLAMKADVNLWRAAFTDWCSKCGEEKYNKHPLVNANVQSYYSECIDNCQAVLNNIDKVYENNNSKPGHGKNEDELPYHLISNHDENAIKNETFQSRVYDEIFGQENSAESIFELQIDQKLCESYSLGLTSMYGHKDAAGQLEVPRSFMNKYERDDLRKYSYTNFPYVTGAQEPAKLAVAKYISKESPTPETMRAQKDIDANWIVYRQTDVMLMMAEALVLQPSVNSNDIKKSFEIVNLINTRSRVDTTNIRNPLKLPADAASAVELVLDERVRELAFEGKRWYDLVRKALRENTTDNIKFVADKLTSNVTSLKNKMLKIDNLFLPIYIDELRFNKNLVQNPAYDSVDSSIGMNK